MNCCPFDLRDYFFGELPAAERREVESHLAACAACGEEFARLGMTKSALLSVPDEEPPRRIAFVSDKVFEPSFWQKLWSSGARLGFASAALLSAAIFAHGYLSRPVAAPVAAVAQVDQKQIEAEVVRRVESALTQKLAEFDQKQAARLSQVSAEQKRMEFDHRADLVVLGENFSVLRKQMGYVVRASNDPTGAGQ